ncbi:MAG: IPT/TIG domain-containing protein [Anaerolineales bacterium]|nr:IPT/TIG domain-containing protein [Anaerolineales bacterium]
MNLRRDLLRAAGFVLVVGLLIPFLTVPAGAGSAALQGPGLSVDPSSGPAGSTVTVSGSGWTGSNPDYVIFWDSVGGTQLGTFSPSGGSWSTNVTIPGGAAPGGHTIWACQGYGGEFEDCVSTGFTVVEVDTPTPSLTFTPSPTFTLSVTPTPTHTPSPTLAECIDEINVLSPGHFDDLGGVETTDFVVEVIYGRDEPPEVLFYVNDRYRAYTQWPDPAPGTTVEVEHDEADPHRYLFTLPDVSIGRGYEEFKVEVPGTCAASDHTYRQFNNGEPFTPTPRPDECGGLGLDPDAPVIRFEEDSALHLGREVRELYGVVFGRNFETYVPETSTPRSGSRVGTSTASAEFGSQLRPIRLSFLRPLQAVGMFVGLDSARYVESEVTATLTLYGYREDGSDLVRLGAVSTSFAPEPSDVVHCLVYEAEAGDRITKASLEYTDTAGTSLAERRIMDDLTLVFSEDEEIPDQPPAVEIMRPEEGVTIDSPDLVTRAEIVEDLDLEEVRYRLNDGEWREVGASPLAEDPTAFYSAAALPHEDLRVLAENTLTYQAEDGEGQVGEDTVTFRYEPDEPFAFHDMEFRFTQHGPFDLIGFPDRMIAHKSSALRVTGLPQFGALVGPVAIDEAELTVNWLYGGSRKYRGHRQAGSGFAPGGPFQGEAEIYFLLDGQGLEPGPVVFELSLTIGERVVYRNMLGWAEFRTASPQYVYVVPFADPLRGQYALDFYTEMMNMARVYPVRDGAAPFGSPLAESGDAGLIFQVSPSHVSMPNGTSPYVPFDSYAWNLVQDEADERARLETADGAPIDCNGDGKIEDEWDLDKVAWLVAAEDGEDRTYAIEKMEPRGSMQWNWVAPEDADGDGVISYDDLSKFVVEFYDLDGDEAWHDFEGAARDRFSPGDPYHTYKDSNRNCILDDGERSTLALGAQRKDNAWNYMRSIAEYRMQQFADEHGLPRMATVAILPASRMTTAGILGNCGDSGICWATAGRGMTIGHELGHGWGLEHDTPREIPDGALNLSERSWIEEGATRNFIFEAVGNQPRENFASVDRFFQLMDQADNGWDYFNLAAVGSGSPGLAAVRQPQPQDTQLVLTLLGNLTLAGELEVQELFVREGAPPAAPEPGEYELVFLTESGDELASVPFGVRTQTVCDGCPHGLETVTFEQPYVTVRAAFPAAAQRIRIRRGDQNLASVERSVYAPEVEWVRAPIGEVERGQTIQLRWQASDRDDEDLTYRLEYSADGGRTFSTVARRLAESSYAWTPDAVPGSSQARLRIVASDGFNRVAETSPEFSLAGAAPQLSIISPETETQVGDQSVLVLEAVAIDAEDGALDGDSIAWFDSNDQQIGRGGRLQLQNLELGEKTFTARASDSEGNEVEASITVEVVESPDPLPARTLAMVETDVSEPMLAAGACQPDQARLTATFPTGMGVQRAVAVVRAGQIPHSVLEMEAEGEERFEAALTVSDEDPVAGWEFAVMSETASGQVWSRPSGFEVVACPESAEERTEREPGRNVPLMLALSALALVVIGGLGLGGYLLLRRRG